MVISYPLFRHWAELMFKAFVVSTLKIIAVLPGSIAVLYGLLQAAEHTGFNHEKPATYEKLIKLINSLLEVLIDYWLGYIIFSALVGFLWALIVAEPKLASKRAFEKRRKEKLGKGKQ